MEHLFGINGGRDGVRFEVEGVVGVVAEVVGLVGVARWVVVVLVVGVSVVARVRQRPYRIQIGRRLEPLL